MPKFLIHLAAIIDDWMAELVVLAFVAGIILLMLGFADHRAGL